MTTRDLIKAGGRGCCGSLLMYRPASLKHDWLDLMFREANRCPIKEHRYLLCVRNELVLAVVELTTNTVLHMFPPETQFLHSLKVMAYV